MPKIIHILITFAIFPSLSWGATVYVDKNVSSCTNYNTEKRICGDGTAKAYSSFLEAFEREDFGPGDSLVARGGTYNSGIKFGSNDFGDPSDQFTVSAFNGESVTLDVTGYCIDTRSNGVEYVTVDGINCELSHSSTYGAYLGGEGSGTDSAPNKKGIIIKNCSFINAESQSVWFNASEFCVFDNNTIFTKDGHFAGQGDGIVFYRGANNTVSNNKIVIRNDNSDAHIDCVQSAWEDNLTIYNNEFYQENTATSNHQFIIIEDADGWSKIYNNIFLKDSGDTGTNVILIFSGTADSYIFHNTILVSGAAGAIDHRNTGDVYIQNNILTLKDNSTLIFLNGGTQSKINIHHNLVNSSLSSGDFYRDNSGFMNLREWQAEGGGQGSIAGINPDLNLAYRPYFESSPVVDAGIVLPSQYLFDKAGNSRPIGIGPDMGAYEAFEGGDDARPMSPILDFKRD